MTAYSMLEPYNEKQRKYFRNYVIVSVLVLLEYINSLLRYFAVFDMARGVFVRKIIFIFLLCYTGIGLIKVMRMSVTRGLVVYKRYITFSFMYVYFVGVYFFTAGKFDITDISNMIMPLIVGILGYKSFFGKQNNFLDKYGMVYVLVLAGIYLVNVIYGEFHYTPVGLNSIYYIVLFFPIVFLMKSTKMRRLLIDIIVLLTLVSLKTTAILCVFCCIAIYYLVKNKQIAQKIVLFPVMASVGILVIYLIAYNVLTIDIFETYVGQNISDGGNGRIEIWNNLLEVYAGGDFLQILFGRGFEGTLNTLGYSAHNDFLEVLFDFGVVGLILLMINFAICMKIGIRMYKANYAYSVVFFMLITEVFVMFLFSNTLFVASYILIVVINIFMLISDFDCFMQSS